MGEENWVSAQSVKPTPIVYENQFPLTIASMLLTSTFLGAITMVVLLTLVIKPPATCTAPDR